MDVFLQTVCCSLADGIVGKISSSETNGISWWKMEDCSCLLLSREIRYLKISILYPPMVQRLRHSCYLSQITIFSSLGSTLHWRSWRPSQKQWEKKITQKKRESEQSTKTFIFFFQLEINILKTYLFNDLFSLSLSCSQNVSVYSKTRFTRAWNYA